MLAIVLAIARLMDFFSLVCPQVWLIQPMMTELQAYTPVAKAHMAKYLAPTLRVAQASTKPTTATTLEAVMCQTRSLKCPELIAHRIAMTPETRYGGAMRMSVV